MVSQSMSYRRCPLDLRGRSQSQNAAGWPASLLRTGAQRAKSGPHAPGFNGLGKRIPPSFHPSPLRSLPPAAAPQEAQCTPYLRPPPSTSLRPNKIASCGKTGIYLQGQAEQRNCNCESAPGPCTPAPRNSPPLPPPAAAPVAAAHWGCCKWMV